jgi:hypothetical protein
MVNEAIDKIHDLELLYEMKYFKYSDKSDRPDHEQGKHDDNIFGYGLALIIYNSRQLTKVPLDRKGKPTEIVFGETYLYQDLVYLVGAMEAGKLMDSGKIKVSTVPSYWKEETGNG